MYLCIMSLFCYQTFLDLFRSLCFLFFVLFTLSLLRFQLADMQVAL